MRPICFVRDYKRLAHGKQVISERRRRSDKTRVSVSFCFVYEDPYPNAVPAGNPDVSARDSQNTAQHPVKSFDSSLISL